MNRKSRVNLGETRLLKGLEDRLDLLKLIGLGLIFGLGAAVPIGPINTEIARRTLKRGMFFGIAFGSGAVLVDIVYASCASLGLGVHLKDNKILHACLSIGGFILLTVLGLLTLRGAARAYRHRKDVKAQLVPDEPTTTTSLPDRGALQYQPKLAQKMIKPETESSGLIRNFISGVMMTGLNPYTLMFWFVALPAGPGKLLEQSHRDVPALLLGVIVGTFGWVLVFSGLLGLLKKFSHDSWIIIADLIGGVTLLGFAAFSLWMLKF